METLRKTLQTLSGISPVKKILYVFIGLLLLVLIIERPGLGQRVGAPLLFPNLITNEASRIDFLRLPGGETHPLSLKKEEGRWKIVNGSTFPADDAKVDRLLNLVANLDRGKPVSDNPERASLFGLSDATSPQVQIWGRRDRQVADLLMGNPNLDGGSYVKKFGGKEVILAPSELFSLVSFSDANSWKDKTLLRVDESQARRVSVTSGKEETLLERLEGKWKVVSPVESEADELALRTFFEKMKNLQADRFADTLEASQANFDTPDYKLSVRMSDDSLKIAVFKKNGDKAEYFAKDGDRNLVYVVSETKVKDLFGLKFDKQEVETEKPAK